jgi:hypothetical protein
MVGQAAGLMEGQLATGYQPYEGQRVAGFTPMQAQAFQQVAGQQVAPQLTDASNMALGAGQAAMGYGQQGAQFGQQGAQFGQQAADIGLKGLGYGQLGSEFGGFGYGIGQAAQQSTAGQAEAIRQAAERYGAQGAGYGAQATELVPQARSLLQSAAGFGYQGSEAAKAAQRAAEQQADVYGQMGASAGVRGEQMAAQAATAAQQGFGAQQAYQQMATSPEAQQAYMSPYMQNVVAQQQRDAIRQADIQRQANQARAVSSGAFGGARQGIVEAELQKNLAQQLGDIQATGSQQAFQQAQQAQQYGAGLGIQGLQAGYQGLQTGLQGTGQAIAGAGLGLQGTGQRLAAGQLGLAGTGQGIQGAQVGLQGLGQAGQLYGLGMQGAQTGLQGTGQQLAAGQLGLSGYQSALQGANLGIQGAQTGISGVQAGVQGALGGIQGAQAGIQGAGLGISGAQAATGAAGQLGALGQTQFGQQMAVTDAIQKYGALQQAQQQQGLDIDYQNYLASQNFPYQQLGFFSDIVRGLPMSQSTQTMYGGQPSIAAQLPGLAMAGYGALGRGKEGGQVKRFAEGGTVAAEAMTLEDARSLPSKLRRLSDTQLAAYSRTVKDAVTLSTIQSELQRRAQARQPYNPSAASTPTLADQVAKRAQAATVGAPGMAGGGIVALQGGGAPMDAPYGTAEELSVYTPGPTMTEWLGNKIRSAKEARVAEDEALRERWVAENAPHVLQQRQQPMIDESAMGMSAPTQAPGIAQLKEVNVEGVPPEEKRAPATTPMAPGIAGAGMARSGAGAIPTTFEEYQNQINQAVRRSPEDQKLLDDMQNRVKTRMERATKQEDTAKYDAIMMAGLAMMGGKSFAEGLSLAAQAGGASYMSGKANARKAMEAAEEADMSFQKYKIALDRNDKKEAGDAYKDFSSSVLKLQEIQSKYAAIGAQRAEGEANRSAALAQKEDANLRGSYNVVSNNIARVEGQMDTLLTNREKQIREQMLLADPKTKQQLQSQLQALPTLVAEEKRKRLGPMYEQQKSLAKKLNLPEPVGDLGGFRLLKD